MIRAEPCVIAERGTSFRGGQTALSFVFLIGAIVVLIGTTLAFLTVSFVNSSFGFQASQRAAGIAFSGASDGVFQLVRDRNFADVTGYVVPVGGDSAVITVTQNSPVSGQATIVSTASASIYQRKVRVVVSVHSTTGQVTVLSWQRI
ncbi:hypothetical protein C4571_00345 [Candidatus Parcubacteria bacterium]|nr:MAG: hypothetical protein C4571_00345 [Candidatus Parcubacteria bacterium]